MKIAAIEKVDDGKTIKVSAENNSFSLKIDDIKKEVILEIDDVRTNKFIAEKKNDEIYMEENVIPLFISLFINIFILFSVYLLIIEHFTQFIIILIINIIMLRLKNKIGEWLKQYG